MPKITVISPVYNGKKYIKNFIKSINNQTFKDFDLLLINDGSNDDTYNVAKSELKKTKLNYKIINKKNGGQSSARNLGIQKSTGEWIVMLDSDDTIQKDYLKNLYNMASKNNCDVAICDINRVNENNIFEESNDNLEYEIKSGKETFCDFIKHKIEIGPVSLLIRKQHLQNLNLKFDENSSYSEEFIFICSLLHDTQNVIHLKQRLYNYCLRSGSVSTGANTQKILNGYNEIVKSNIKYYNCECDACKVYNEFAMPRWILATARFTSKNLKYKDWLNLMKSLNYKENIKKLYKFDDLKIKICSVLLNLSPRITYLIFSQSGG